MPPTNIPPGSGPVVQALLARQRNHPLPPVRPAGLLARDAVKLLQARALRQQEPNRATAQRQALGRFLIGLGKPRTEASQALSNLGGNLLAMASGQAPRLGGGFDANSLLRMPLLQEEQAKRGTMMSFLTGGGQGRQSTARQATAASALPSSGLMTETGAPLKVAVHLPQHGPALQSAPAPLPLPPSGPMPGSTPGLLPLMQRGPARGAQDDSDPLGFAAERAAEIGSTALDLTERAFRPYVSAYQNHIVHPFREGLTALARSPLGDPGLYASLQGLGPSGAVAGTLGRAAASGLRVLTGVGRVETVTVGRVMSRAEYEAMKRTGRVRESRNKGVTSVSVPPSRTTYRAGNPKDIYVEFDVPASVVHGGDGLVGKIYGPNSLHGSHYGVTEMPSAWNIRVPE